MEGGRGREGERRGGRERGRGGWKRENRNDRTKTTRNKTGVDSLYCLEEGREGVAGREGERRGEEEKRLHIDNTLCGGS